MKRQALLFVVLASLLGTTLAFGGSYWGRGGSSGGGGSVTSIATTGPLSGGTITTTGTLSCPTCTTSAGMTSGVIPVASGAHALVDSVVSQSGSVVTVTGSLGVTTANTPASVIYIDGSGHLSQSDINGNTNFVYDPTMVAVKGAALALFTEALTGAILGGAMQSIENVLFIDTADTFPGSALLAGITSGASHGGSGNLVTTGAGGLSGVNGFGTVGGSGNAPEVSGVSAQVSLTDNAGGGGNITNGASLDIVMPFNVSATAHITNSYGLWLNNGNVVGTGPVTNVYGFRLDTITGNVITTMYGGYIDAQNRATTTNVGLHIGNISGASTTNRSIETGTGDVVLGTLTGTGAATGKTIVCADTNGKLYRSSSGVACAN